MTNRNNSSIRRMLILARRVVQQLAADRRTVALILIAPLVVLTVAGVLMRAGTTNVRIGIVMQDTGTTLPLGMGSINLGQRLTENLSKISDNIQVKTLSTEESETLLNRGDLDAVITLPENFSESTANKRELIIPVKFEGSNPMAAKLLDTLVAQGAVQTLASVSSIAAVASGGQSAPKIHLDATYKYGNANFDSLDYIAPVFIGLFVFLFVFILTSVAFLRERAAGTLERLQATPIRQMEIVLGYMFGFALFALVQAVIILGFTIFGLKVHYSGSLLVVFVVELLLALMAVNLGIFFSTFARNEFQVVQFIPLVVVTQILLSGAFWAVKDMPSWLQPIAWLMPLTHANQALRDVMIKGADFTQIFPYVAALIAFAGVFIVLASQTVRSQARG